MYPSHAVEDRMHISSKFNSLANENLLRERSRAGLIC